MNIENTTSCFPEYADIPPELLTDIPVRLSQYLLDGRLLDWNGPNREVYAPVHIRTANGLEPLNIGSYPLFTEQEALAALEAAVTAYDNGKGKWPTMSVAERIQHLVTFTSKMKEKRDPIIRMIVWEIGKSLQDSAKEFDRTIQYINDTVSALKDLDRSSSRFTIEDHIIGQIRRSPLGVVLCMGPFNYPLNETFTTLIPALIMGNTIVFKPPKQGVLLFHFLMSAFCDSFPKGVVNVICGEGRRIIPPIMSSGKINVLALIGTSPVANSLRKMSPNPNRLRCVLGLEAKNPAIIMPDADLDVSIKECLSGSLSFNGQRCTALKILFVHTDIMEQFLDRFNASLLSLSMGMPWQENVVITPLAEKGKPEYLNELIQDALSKGSKIINQNGGFREQSFFYPAVLFPVNEQMRIYHEEQFGPVIPVVPFTTIDTPVDYVIHSHYGQQLSIFATSPDTIASLIDPLVNQVSRININSQCQRGPDSFPFTGRKDSAEGTLSVSDALRAFSIRTLVAARDNRSNQEIISHIVRENKSNFLSTDFIF